MYMGSRRVEIFLIDCRLILFQGYKYYLFWIFISISGVRMLEANFSLNSKAGEEKCSR